MFTGFIVTKKLYLVSKNKKILPFFHVINQYDTIEEIFPSFIEISSNIELINNKSLLKNKKKVLGIISVNSSGKFFANSLKLPKFFKIINPNLFLFQVFVDHFKFKFIIKFEF